MLQETCRVHFEVLPRLKKIKKSITPFGECFRYNEDAFNTTSFTSQNRNSLLRFLHNYLGLQISRHIMLSFTITDNSQMITATFQLPSDWGFFHVNNKQRLSNGKKATEDKELRETCRVVEAISFVLTTKSAKLHIVYKHGNRY